MPAMIRNIERIRPGRGILFVNCQGYGDVVCSLPLLRAIESGAKSDCPVYVLFLSPAHFELLKAENLNIRPLFMDSAWAGLRGLVFLWSRIHGKIDLVVGAPEISERKLVKLKRLLGASRLVAESRAAYRNRIPESVPLDWTKSFLEAAGDLASALGITVPLAPPRITITPEESAWADSVIASWGGQGHPRLGVQCGAVVPAKRWQGRNFGAVIRTLKKSLHELSVVSFGTSCEQSETDEARRAAPGVRWIDGSGAWNIRQSLAVLSKCDLFLSGDTGLMHLAAAAGVPTLSLFGPTSPVRRAPIYPHGVAAYSIAYCEYCQSRCGSTRREPFNEPVANSWTSCVCIRNIPSEVIAALALECLKTPARGAKACAAPYVGILRGNAVDCVGYSSSCMQSRVGEG